MIIEGKSLTDIQPSHDFKTCIINKAYLFPVRSNLNIHTKIMYLLINPVSLYYRQNIIFNTPSIAKYKYIIIGIDWHHSEIFSIVRNAKHMAKNVGLTFVENGIFDVPTENILFLLSNTPVSIFSTDPSILHARVPLK